MKTEIDDELFNRLYNFKFDSAWYLIENKKVPIPKNKELVDYIKFLAEEYDDVGWICGNAGDRIHEQLLELGVDLNEV